MELNVRAVLFDAYVTAMKRGRWLLMTTTLLSALLAANVFLEQWGYQRNQLEGIEANRAFFNTPERRE